MKYDNATVLAVGYSGGVGVNKDLPTTALDVAGSVAVSENVSVTGILTVGTGSNQVTLGSDDNIYQTWGKTSVGISTVINVGDTNGNRTEATSGHWQNTAYNLVQHTTNFIDSPSTTSATTYKLQWADWYNNTVWLNRAHHSYDYSYHYSPNSTITLWEVGA